MLKSSRLIFIMAIVIAVAIAFGGGFYAGHYTGTSPGTITVSDNLTGTDNNTLSIPKNLTLVEEAWDYLVKDYVELPKLASENITRGAIEGIIGALEDPHMSYLNADDFKMVQSNFQGEFDGIGAMVGIRGENLTIIAPIKGTPADKAGIKSGDIIFEINGESVKGMSLDVAISKIRGPAGTNVKLLILHLDETTPAIIEITRANIEVASLDFEMRGDIALLSIYQFTNRTEIELRQIMPRLAEENATGIILDLRGNPGGILNIVVEVASHFITDGTIVSVISNQGVMETHNAKKQDVTTDLPMVVLVDEGSASGSEVLTGALQDHHRALVSGNVTYGKGSVNILRRLSDGSGIYITNARWLTPDGRMIEGNGIEPDIILDVTGEEEIQWAIDYLHGE